MSKIANNTHRRAMRTVTPAVRAGRATAGAAMAATMLFGGAAMATAEPQADAAPIAPQAEPGTVIAPVTAPAVGITSVEKSTSNVSFAPSGGSISVETGPTAEEIAAAEREAAEAAAAEQAEQERAAAEQAETRDEDDSADRTHERSSREGTSNDEASEEREEESAPAPSAGKGSSILATARNGIGVPYVFGGTSTSGWDCSGFVQWVYKQHGVNLPRGAADQAAAGTVIPRSQAQPGDLVYKPGHIGIYAGGNTFVDAGNSRVDTSERNIYSGSWTFIRIGG